MIGQTFEQFADLKLQKKKPTFEQYAEVELGDWRKELPSAIKETWEELPAAEFGKPRYWGEAGKRLGKQAREFTTGAVGPGLFKSNIEAIKRLTKEPSLVKVGKKAHGEAARGAFEFAVFLPKTAFKFAKDPVGTIRDDPLGVIFLAGITGKGIASKWRAKAKGGQPITKQNVMEVVKKVPEEILSKEQKAGIKTKLPEQLELPVEKMGTKEIVDTTANIIKQNNILRKYAEKAPEKIGEPEAGGIAYGMEIPKTIAGVRLDKLNAPYDVKLELANLAGTMHSKLKQKRVSWAETESLANEMGITVESLKKARAGKAFNAAELEATRKMTGASIADTLEKHKAYIKNPSDANLIAFRGALERSGMILRTLREKKAQAGRALNILKKKYEPGEVKYDFFERILKELGGREKNLEIIEKFRRLDLDNPVSVNKFLRDITKPKLSDKIFEVWVNAILSGPPSQVRNIVSNTFMVFDKIATTAGAALLEAPKRIIGKKPNVYFGEVPATVFGIWNGFKEGVRKFAFAWENEMTMEGVTKLEMRHPAAIKGKTGRTVRIPGRGLVAFDEFFKSIINTMDIHAQAYRRAVSEGLKGEARLKRISELITDPDPDMIVHATGERIARTFQAELGKAGKAVQKVRGEIPGLRYIIPFTRVPINIPKQAFYRTPLNFARIVALSAKGKLRGAAMSEEIAKAGLGTATAIGIFMLAKEELVTGSPPDEKNERDAFYREGKQPRSIKIGNQWISYEPIEPLGTLMAVSADAAKIWDRATEGERDRIASMLVQSGVQNISDKTFMRGLSTALNAISDPMRGGEHFIESFAGTVVPTGVAYAARAKDPYLRDAQSVIDSIKAGLAETLPLRRDAWGRSIRREGAVAERFISPFYHKTEDPTALDNELKRLKLFIGQPSRRVGKEKLKPRDYSVMSQQIGQTLFRVLNGLVQQPMYLQSSDEEKKKRIRSVVQQVRKIGRIPYYKPPSR